MGTDDHHAQSHTLDSHTGTLQHEKGGLESDVSAGDGYVEIKAGSATVRKSNLVATVAPGATDDSAAGYSVGSFWIDTTNDKAYVCLDATAAAAVWTEVTQGGGGGTDTSVFVTLSANQSVANGVEAVILFDQEDFDTDTMHDNSTNKSRLTCKTAGKFLIFGEMEFQNNSTGRRSTLVRLNGTTKWSVEPGTNQNASHRQCIVGMMDLAVNDYVELVAYQNSGGSLNVGSAVTFFGMCKVLG